MFHVVSKYFKNKYFHNNNSAKPICFCSLLLFSLLTVCPFSASAETISYLLGGSFGPSFRMEGQNTYDDFAFKLKFDAATGLIGTLDTDAGTFLVSGTLLGRLTPGTMGVAEDLVADVEMLYSGLSFESINGTDYWVGREDSVSSGSISGNMLGEDYSFDLTGKFANITPDSNHVMREQFQEFMNTGPFSAVLGALQFDTDSKVFFESWIQNSDEMVEIAGMPLRIQGDFHTTITAENPEPATLLLFLIALGFVVYKKRRLAQ